MKCFPLYICSQKIQRDIGVILLPDSVHIHMTGSNDTGPYFSSSVMASFGSWAKERIDEGLGKTDNINPK